MSSLKSESEAVIGTVDVSALPSTGSVMWSIMGVGETVVGFVGGDVAGSFGDNGNNGYVCCSVDDVVEGLVCDSMGSSVVGFIAGRDVTAALVMPSFRC